MKRLFSMPRAALRARPAGLALLVAIAALGSSCAYYNTFYLAKKYYVTATGGAPYAIDRTNVSSQSSNYQKALDFSKKVVAHYPSSKWADDAYLMWARALLGRDDPLQSVEMLRAFDSNFPNSPLQYEARFYLGVALRQARKYREALVPLDEFVEKQPRHDLVAYAHFERARALTALGRHAESAAATSGIIDRFPKSELVDASRGLRAEALLASGEPERARSDFQQLGLRARTDEERFTFLLREVDCLEAARDFDGSLALLQDAISHEVPPARPVPGVAVQTLVGSAGAAGERYGRLKIRIGTAHLLAGRSEQALTEFRSVLADYPKTALAAEAQYRIAYAYETVLDDFDLARQEYGKVRDQSISSAFFAQATQRMQSLERLARYRGAGGDSLGRRTEAGFMLAEQYLFQLDKPERALEAYREIAREHAGTDVGAKAMVAEAWVLRRKLERAREADSILWTVVREHPATEAQLAARDFLEAAGEQVPADLIKLPERVLLAQYEPELTPPPAADARLGLGVAGADSAQRLAGFLTGARDSAARVQGGFLRGRDEPIVPGSTAAGAPPTLLPQGLQGSAAATPSSGVASATPDTARQTPSASATRAPAAAPGGPGTAPVPAPPASPAGQPPPAGAPARPADPSANRAAPSTGEEPGGPPPPARPARPAPPPQRSPLDDPPRPGPDRAGATGAARP